MHDNSEGLSNHILEKVGFPEFTTCNCGLNLLHQNRLQSLTSRLLLMSKLFKNLWMPCFFFLGLNYARTIYSGLLFCELDPKWFFTTWFFILRSKQTRTILTSVAYIHLKHTDVLKYTKNLSPASRAILLSGPAGSLNTKNPHQMTFEFFTFTHHCIYILKVVTDYNDF